MSKVGFDYNAWNANRPGTRPSRPGEEKAQVAKSGRPAPGSVPKPGTPGGPRAPKGLECGNLLAYGDKKPFDFNAWHAARPS